MNERCCQAFELPCELPNEPDSNPLILDALSNAHATSHDPLFLLPLCLRPLPAVEAGRVEVERVSVPGPSCREESVDGRA